MKKIIIFILILFSFNSIYGTNNEKYILNSQDYKKLDSLIFKINIKIQEGGEKYKNEIIDKIDKILNEKTYNSRLLAFLEKIKIEVIEIEVVDIKLDKKNGIDYNLIKNNWLGMYNQVRRDLGKKDYILDEKLSNTALEWSKLATERGEITHKRNSGDSYYDYWKITSWFKERGIVCKNINRITYSENIGYGSYTCSDGDCTDELNNAVKSVFNFFMSEKNKSYQPHYKSIISNYFTKIGVGIDTSEISDGYYRYYITIHYCTELLN